MLFLSIHPEYVEAIVEGRKSVELRKRRPSAAIGSRVAIYATTPQCEIVAVATLAQIEVASPSSLWKSVRTIAAVTKSKFDEYYAGHELAVALHFTDISVLSSPIPLRELRQKWDNFQPPQQFRYLDQRQRRLIEAQVA